MKRKAQKKKGERSQKYNRQVFLYFTINLDTRCTKLQYYRTWNLRFPQRLKKIANKRVFSVKFLICHKTSTQNKKMRVKVRGVRYYVNDGLDHLI